MIIAVLLRIVFVKNKAPLILNENFDHVCREHNQK